MIVKLLTEHHLEFLNLKGGCRGSSKSTLVKMSNCLKFHAVAQTITCEPLIYTMDHPKFMYLTRRKNPSVQKELHIHVQWG